MTGHDLDLDAIRADHDRIGRCTLYTRSPEQFHRMEAAERLADAIPVLLAEIESLRAKLAAAERERDEVQAQRERYYEAARQFGQAANHAEAELAAERAKVERVRGWRQSISGWIEPIRPRDVLAAIDRALAGGGQGG